MSRQHIDNLVLLRIRIWIIFLAKILYKQNICKLMSQVFPPHKTFHDLCIDVQ